MSDALTNRQQGSSGYEPQDLSSRHVMEFLVALVVGGLLVVVLVWGIYHFLDARARARQPKLGPLAKPVATGTRIVPDDAIMKFPEPRLEQNERLELRDFRTREEQTLNSYGWVDEKNGVVRIPIERAMQLTAQRGLPVIQQSEAVSTSEAKSAPTKAQAPK
jgi:hypothetical protein